MLQCPPCSARSTLEHMSGGIGARTEKIPAQQIATLSLHYTGRAPKQINASLGVRGRVVCYLCRLVLGFHCGEQCFHLCRRRQIARSSGRRHRLSFGVVFLCLILCRRCRFFISKFFFLSQLFHPDMPGDDLFWRDALISEHQLGLIAAW